MKPPTTAGIDLSRLLADKSLTLAQKTDLVLDATAKPYPAPRSQGVAARTNKALDTLSVPMPTRRPERDPTEATPRPVVEGIEFAPNGQPRDPDTGFLMDKRDPRYAEIMGIKEAPTPASTADRDKARGPGAGNKPVARLPELPPPGEIKRPTPGQSFIERSEMPTALIDPTPNDKPMSSAGMNLKEMLASESMNTPTPTSTSNKTSDSNVTSARAEQNSQRGKSAKSPIPQGVVRVAGGMAGQVALPAGVRPEIPEVPSLHRIAETLPNGSNQTYAGQDRAVSKPVAPKPTPQSNLDLARSEQAAARGNVAKIDPVLTRQSKITTPSNAVKRTQERAIAALPELAESMPATSGGGGKKKPGETVTALPPSKNDPGPGDSLGDIFEGIFGDWSGDKDKGNNDNWGKGFMKGLTEGHTSDTFARTGTASIGTTRLGSSKGYKEIRSDGGHVYNAQQGTWDTATESKGKDKKK